MAYTVSLPKSELLPRVLTGLVAIPVVIFLTFQEPIFLKIILSLTAFGLFREWSNLSFAKPYHWLSSVCLLAILVSFHPTLRMGGMLLVLAGCGWLIYLKPFSLEKLKIICGGYLYITSAMAIIVHIMPDIGPQFMLLVFTLIWCIDTGAFLVGRVIGGPKLAPTISPNKTWSGFIGGAIAGLVGVSLLIAAMKFKVIPAFWIFVCVSVLLAQGGDLLESWGKRYFKVKDSGSFFPGHGGLLDRLDSLLAVSFAIAVLWYFCG